MNIFKKVTSTVLAVCMLLSLAACGGKPNPVDSTSSPLGSGTNSRNATNGNDPTATGDATGSSQSGQSQGSGDATQGDGKTTSKTAGGNNSKPNDNKATTSTKNGDKPGTTTTTKSGGNGKPAVDIGKATVSLTYLGNPVVETMVKKLKTGFEAKYKGATLKLIPKTGAYDDAILRDYQAGTLGDAVFVFNYMQRTYSSSGLLAPIDDHLKAFGFNADDLVSTILAQCKGSNGKLYMMPQEYSQNVVVVNKSMLSDMGEPMPKDNWTLSDFERLIKKATVKGQTYGVAAAHQTYDMYSAFIYGHGGKFWDDKTKKLTMSDPKAVAGLEKLFGYVKAGYMTNYYDASNSNTFNDGNILFTITGKSQLSAINTALSGKRMQWDILPLFTMPNGHVSAIGTIGYGMNSKTKNTKATAAFLDYVASEDGQKKLVQTGQVVPVLKAVQTEGSWKNYPVPNKNQNALVYKPETDITDYIFMKLNASKQTIFTTEMQKYQLQIFANQITVADAMKALDKAVNGG